MILFVISGPSGAGKSTLCERLLAEVEGLRWSVSCTTRPPRPGEVGGRSYRFVSPEAFEEMVRRGEFLEWAEVYGHRYGTPWEEVRRAEREGVDLLLDLDTQGALRVRQALGERVVLVFLLPPSPQDLRRRLEGRGTEDRSALERRWSWARQELLRAERYDYLVLNDSLEAAARRLRCIVEAERCRTARRRALIEEVRSAWLGSP